GTRALRGMDARVGAKGLAEGGARATHMSFPTKTRQMILPKSRLRHLPLLASCTLLLLLLACAARPRGPLAYVTNERDGTITVIDTATDRVVSTFSVGGRLRGVRVGSDGARVYVAASTPSGKNYDPKENHVAAVDARGGEVLATYEVGSDP